MRRVATNSERFDELVREAMVLGGHKTGRAAVTRALEEYVRRLKQEKVAELFGTVEFDPTYDYKRQRQRQRK